MIRPATASLDQIFIVELTVEGSSGSYASTTDFAVLVAPHDQLRFCIIHSWAPGQ